MNTEQKNRLQGVADKAAQKVAEKAKAASGWKKWLYGVLAVLLGAAAYFLSGCGQVTPEQLQAVHGVYHVVTGKPCVFEGGKK
jgi:hypothetical protein